MKIKKTIKYVFFVLCVILIVKITIKEMFDNRPFKFEKYKTEENLEEAVKVYFPVDSDLDRSILELEKSGARCHNIGLDVTEHYKALVSCEYKTINFTKLNLLYYEIGLYADINRKLIKIDARRFYDVLWP